MRILTPEEHVVFPLPASKPVAGFIAKLQDQLADLSGERLQGIDLQVLSVVGPGADLLSGDEAVALAQDYNNAIASRIKGDARFRAFAHLPVGEPGLPRNWNAR